MTSIEDLFDWILEDIFKMLPREDRLVCKEVNRRWYNILMERITFRADRHIFLKTSEIKAGAAPMDVLMKAQKPYEIYTIIDDAEDNINALPQFLEHVGKFVVELNYRGCGNCCNILTTMPSLKSLTLALDLSDAARNFTVIKRTNPNFTFSHLESIQIGDKGHMNNAIQHINTIKNHIPKNCDIILKLVYIGTYDQIELLTEIMEEVTNINHIYIFGLGKTQAEIEKLLKANNINCDIFGLTCTSEHSPFPLLEILQNKHKNLKEIQLFHEFLQPDVIDLPKLTTLKLMSFDAPYFSYKSLEKMSHLKELCFHFENECTFGHESLFMPNLKMFGIHMSDSLCEECLQALSNSFENMEDFTFLTNKKFAWNALKKVTHNWAKNLRSLKVEKLSNMDLKTIEEMSEAFPNLEELNLEAKDSLLVMPLSKTVKALVASFKKLNEFTFRNNDPGYMSYHKLDEFSIICDYLDSVGLPLKNQNAAMDIFKVNKINLTLNRAKMTSQMALAVGCQTQI